MKYKNNISVIICFFVFLLFNQQLINAAESNVVDLYVNPSSTTADDGCGVDVGTACSSIPKALAQYQKSVVEGSDNSLILHLVDGVYTGDKNSNIDVYSLNVTLVAVTAGNPSVVFDGSADTVGYNSIFSVVEPETFIASNTSKPTVLTMSNIAFTKVSSLGGIVSSYLRFGSLSLSIDSCVFNNNTRRNDTTTANTAAGIVVSIDGARNNTQSYTVSITNSNFNFNSAPGVMGPVIYFGNNVIGTISNCNFNGNTGSSGSNAIYSAFSSINVVNSVFENHASNECSAITIFQEGDTISSFNNCTFNNNVAYSRGGVLCAHYSNTNLTNSIFSNNKASSNGGAFFSIEGYTIFTNVTFNSNTAQKGGALSLQDEAFVKSYNSVFNSNIANGDGGAISVEWATVQLFGSAIKSSTSNDRGGAIFTYHSHVLLENSTIDGNVSPFGGAIFCSASEMTMTTTNVNNNTDTHYGTHSYEYEDGSMEILVNDRNIYCSQFPAYTFCTISGDTEYSSLCGEVYVVNKPAGLSKGQLAGIIIGSILGAAVLAFGFGVLWAKSTISEIFTPLKATINEDEDSDEHTHSSEVKHL